MKKYISKRVLMSILTLFVIVLVLFALMQMMPGSPFNDEKLSVEQQLVLRNKYGLNDPVPVQFFRYVKNMARVPQQQAEARRSDWRNLYCDQHWLGRRPAGYSSLGSTTGRYLGHRSN